MILSSGNHPIVIESRNLDSKSYLREIYENRLIYWLLTHSPHPAVPEIQGTTQEVARDKCRRAAELVSITFPLIKAPDLSSEYHPRLFCK